MIQPAISIIGANGFVGSNLVKIGRELGWKIIPVVRSDGGFEKARESTIVIHAANSGRRYWADQNPEKDLENCIQTTSKIFSELKGKKLILISSISARSQTNTPYGRNRKACEDLAVKAGALIIRLGPMFGGGKSAGPLHDLIQNKTVFVSGDSEYAYASVEDNARKIFSCLNHEGLLELGAHNFIRLSDLRDRIGSTSEFIGAVDNQRPISPPENSPDAQLVVNFALRLKEESNHG
jgi:nucleoside-diphosphate-sugar epimerase